MKNYLALASAILLATPAAAATFTATQITTDNRTEFVDDGPDTSASIGDWALSNGTICVTVSALDRESEMATTGGALTDVSFCDRDDDHIATFHDLFGDTPLRAERIEAYQGDKAAAIIVHGNAPGMTTKVTYTLSADRPDRLQISKEYRVTGDTDGLMMIPRVWFNYYSMTPYVINLTDPAKSAGSNLKAFVGRPSTDIADYAQMADLIVATSAADDTPAAQGGSGEAIAYGWRHVSSIRTMADGAEEELPTFAVSEIAATAFTTFTNGFWVESDDTLGLAQMVQMPLMSPDEGDTIRIVEELLLAPRADAASITDQLYTGTLIKGAIANADVATIVHIATKDGAPVTYARPAANGAFEARVPAAGEYQLIIKSAGSEDITQLISVAGTEQTLAPIDTLRPVRLVLPRSTTPMRLTILGINGTPTPDLADNQLGTTITGENGLKPHDPMPYIFLAGVAGDQSYVDLPAGDYRVLASRGLEYSVEETTITLAKGDGATLSVKAPIRAVDTPGQLAADFHTHAAPSIDSVMATGDRVTSFIAEGGEILVASEHETIFDYTPVLEATGLKGHVIVVNGTEITSEVSSPRNPYTIGHANAFPVTVKPDRWRRGQPMNEGRRWRDVNADLRRDWPEAIFQLNHPTIGKKVEALGAGDPQETAGGRGYFLDHMGPVGRQFDPSKPLTDPHNSNLIEADPITGLRDIDFDAVELLNGPWYDSYRMMRDMWISWLKQGEFVVGVANSDSHNKAELVGWPVNYIAMGADTIADYTEQTFVDAVRAGKVISTTGPVLQAKLNGVGPGDLLNSEGATLTVTVDAADWVQDPSGAYDLRISVNGTVVDTGKIKAGEIKSLDLTFEKDSFVLVEVEGEASDTYKLIAPGHKPLAFSNPIFIDADHDGKWTAPGF